MMKLRSFAVAICIYLPSIQVMGVHGSTTLLTLVPFTLDGEDNAYFTGNRHNNQGFSHMAASLLAIDQFNNRNPEVVPELAMTMFENCSIYFNESSVVEDTKSRGIDAVAEVLAQLDMRNVPDAIVGGYNELAAMDLSVVANSLQIPYVSYGGSNILVVTPYFYPYSSRTSPDVGQIGRAIVSFLLFMNRTNFIGVLQVVTDTGAQLKETISSAATRNNARLATRTYVPSYFASSNRTLQASLEALKTTGFRTIVVIVEVAAKEIPKIADIAEELGMTTNEYFWLFAGNINVEYFSSPDVRHNANMTRLLKGAATIFPLDDFLWNPAKDRFLASWKRQNSTFVDRVNAKNPILQQQPGYYFADDDYFQRVDPEAGAGFIYDSVMSIGIGLCSTQASGNRTEWSLVASTQSSEFRGATGLVTFGSKPDYPGGRSDETVTFGIYNILPPGQEDVGYSLTHYRPGNESINWVPVAPFYFADGSTIPPALLRATPEQNYMSSGVRIFGLTLFSLALLTAVASLLWVYLNRENRVVKAAQPVCLYFIIFGSALMAFAIFTNSFDEGCGWSEEQLSKMCTASPWAVCLGVVVTYSALFTKLWRVNKIFQFRRRTVQFKHVVWPAVALFAIAITILTTWTILEGFEWVRMEVNPSTGESMGKCEGIHTEAYFIPIFILVVIPVLMTGYMAWKTKDIDSSFSESSWIFALIAVQLQVLVVSIPVLDILEDQSSSGRYLGQTMVFWTFSMSSTLLIIGPKVFAVHMRKETETRKRGASSGEARISGLDLPSGSTPPDHTIRPSPSQPTESSMGSNRNDDSREIGSAHVPSVLASQDEEAL